MKRIVLLFSFLLYCAFTIAQDFSNKGKDFWIAYGHHIRMLQPANPAEKMQVYITSDVSTSGVVDIPSISFSQPFTVTANQISTIDIPRTAALVNEGLYNHGIHVTANSPVVVYSFIYVNAVSGATLCLPTNVLGREYYSINYTQLSNETADSYSYFAVVATEDNTSVEITPSQATKGGKPANVMFPVTLNKGQIYQVLSASDLTGSVIRSVSSGASGCKRIGVFSGSGKISIGCTSVAASSDNLYQQVYPNNSWGKTYITTPSTNNGTNVQTNFFRIIRPDASSVVTLNGNVIPSTSFTNNFYYQFSSNTTNVITSDKAIMVAQYFTTSGAGPNCGNSGIGDPEMIYLNSVEQTISKVTLNSMQPSSGTALTTHFINAVLRNTPGSINSFKIDGISQANKFSPVTQNTNFAYARIPVASQGHTITCDSGFNAIAYGFGNAESYGYSAGTNVTDLYQYVTIQNPNATVNFPATCKGTPFRFSITLPYQPTSMLWDFGGNANLTPNSNVTNNAPVPDSTFVKDGRTLYVFKLPGNYLFTAAGTYTIKVQVNNPTADGCSGLQEISYDVTVYDKPTTDFTITHTGCVTDPVNFSDGSTGSGRPITKWKWDFGDTNIDNVQNPSHLYASAGTGSYSVHLTSYNDIGCVADTFKTVPVSSLPFVKFGVTDTVCAARNITLTDSSTIAVGTMVKWYWDYGNGIKDTLTATSPRTVAYPATGPYTISLKVETNTGCTNVFTKTINVTPDPVVGFILPEVCLADAAAVFTDTSKIADGSESQFKYLWTFNAGTPAVVPGPTPATSIVKNGSAKYNKADNYTVNLKVTSKDGCMVELSKTFTVNGSIPVSDFNVLNATSLCSNTAVQIQNTSTVDFGSITKVEIYWDYGTSPTVKFTDDDPQPNEIYTNLYANFQQPASKTITIRFLAYSGGTCSSIRTRTITLNASPKVQFATMPGICLDAAARQITQAIETGGVAGSSPAAMYYGTGVSSAGLFAASAAGVGTFPIKYVYTSDKGCKDSATNNITVWPSPSANFGFSAPSCEKNDITFTDTSVANFSKIVTWQWDLGNSTTLTRNNANPFTYQYATGNTYNVSLKVITDSGCISPIKTKPVKVNYLPLVNFSLPEVCLPDGNALFNDLSAIPDASESLFTYRWDFNDPNDATPSTIKNPTHKYSALAPTGGYQVKLKITSKDGCIDSLTKAFTKVYPQPKANFSATPLEVCLGDTIHFADLSNGMTSNVNAWNWNFGDGTNSTLQNPFRVYKDSGSFTVRLFVYNSQGCVSDTFPTIVTIHPYPVLDAGPDLFVLEGGTVQIKTDYYATNPSFLWTPPLYLNNDTLPRPSSSPAIDMTYYVKLTGIGGCSDTSSVFITVLRKPVIPNAFSPNGDGVNDTWSIKYLESYPGATVEIFDRGGRQVFSSFNYAKDWDGTFNGKELPVGTYYYIINPKNGRPIMSGYVAIIR